MAVISCPNCQGKLRFPDDSPPRKVKCPSCSHSFKAGPKGPVTGDETATSATKTKEEEPVKGPAKKQDDDFEVVDDDKPARSRSHDDDDDRPRSKRRDNDDDDDRGRKRRRDDDDDDDRPRSKRRSDDDDDRDRKRRDRDDDDDDRPRSKRRGRDDDDDRPRSRRRDEDDDDRRKPKETPAQWRNGRQAFNLIAIGFWCQVGALGIVLFWLFLAFIANEYVEELLIPAGLAGLANWILACIGFSFFVAGPKKGNLLGLTIALIAVSGLHLVMELYLSFQKERTFYGSGTGTIRWDVLPTQLPAMANMIIRSTFVTAVLITAVLEVARFVLFALVLKEYGRICKDRDVSGTGNMLLVGLPAILGISLILFLIVRMIFKNAGAGSEGRYIVFIMLLIEYGGYITAYCFSALACGKAKEAIIDRKQR